MTYLILILATVLFFIRSLYKKDLKLRKLLEEEVKKEDIIVNNRDLIIKKGKVVSLQAKYKKTVNQNTNFTNKRD